MSIWDKWLLGVAWSIPGSVAPTCRIARLYWPMPPLLLWEQTKWR